MAMPRWRASSKSRAKRIGMAPKSRHSLVRFAYHTASKIPRSINTSRSSPWSPSGLLRVVDADGDGHARDERVGARRTQAAADGADGDLAVRKLAPDAIDVDGRRVGDPDGHVHEHPPPALAHLLEQRQARMPDRIRHRPAGRLRPVSAVDVDAHSELEHLWLDAHSTSTRAPLSCRLLTRHFSDAVADGAPHHPLNRQQIDERPERAVLDAVLGAAETARAVLHRDFDHPVARRPEQGRHEPMHTGVRRDRTDTLPT